MDRVPRSQIQSMSGPKGNMFRNTRRYFLRSAAVGTAALALPKATASVKKRPNVVLVMTDDQGYGDLACHGNPVIRTHNIDRLYSQSVHLTNFHVSPTCSPTRAALMTGRYCNRTGVWHTIMGRSLLRRDEKTMADVFAAGGYRTAIFGKWHLGDNYPFRPQDRGFQEVLIHGGGGVGQTPDYWGNDYFDDTYFHNGQPRKFAGYCTDVWFDGALRFIEVNKDRPFFCYLPTNAPHGPYLVAEKYGKPYEEQGVEQPRAAFYGMIENIDENMGRLMTTLKSLGIEDNTILIFMTDNGTAAGAVVDGQGFVTKGYNAGMRGTKGSEYDGGHRVPCLIRWPGGGLEGSRDIGRIAAHVDLLPTLIDMCGLDKPAGMRFDGEGLAPLLRGESDACPDRTLVVDSQRIEVPEKWRRSAVMTDRWRLINGKELYDMSADPEQKEDVAGDHPSVVDRLRAAYEDWWTDTSARFGEYCEIVIGSDEEDPARLACHDWHAPEVPWNQRHIRAGLEANGFWAVEIERDGTYEFALRRWPEEVDKPVVEAVPGGKPIGVTQARLKIANVDVTKPVTEEAAAVTFEVKLRAGKTRLQTWFTDEKGASRGAYYVYVTRLKV